MRLYPAAPRPLRATLAADLVVLLLLAVFGVLGTQVHDGVDQLSLIGEGVEEAGSSVKRALDTAADGTGSLPLVGGELADTLRAAGESTGRRAIDAGRDGQESAHGLARFLGWLTFAIPALLLAAAYLPRRIAQVRRLTAAARLLTPAVLGHERLLAQRAAFSLPYSELARHTRDPFGDLEREHYAPLVAAALEDAGLRAPGAR